MSNKLKFVFLQIPRLPYGRDECSRCETLLQKIAFAFKHMNFLQTRPVELSEMTTEIDKIAQLEYARKEGREEERI